MIFTHHCVSPAFTLWNRLYEIKSYVRSSTSLAAVLEVKGAEWGRRGQNCYVWVSDCGGGTFYNSLLNLIPFSSSFYLHATLHFEGESHKYGNYEAGWVTQEDVSLWVCQIFLHGGFRLGRCRIRSAVEALQLAALNFCWKWPLNHCFLLMPDDIRRNERLRGMIEVIPERPYHSRFVSYVYSFYFPLHLFWSVQMGCEN